MGVCAIVWPKYVSCSTHTVYCLCVALNHAKVSNNSFPFYNFILLIFALFLPILWGFCVLFFAFALLFEPLLFIICSILRFLIVLMSTRVSFRLYSNIGWLGDSITLRRVRRHTLTHSHRICHVSGSVCMCAWQMALRLCVASTVACGLFLMSFFCSLVHTYYFYFAAPRNAAIFVESIFNSCHFFCHRRPYRMHTESEFGKCNNKHFSTHTHPHTLSALAHVFAVIARQRRRHSRPSSSRFYAERALNARQAASNNKHGKYSTI